MEEGIPDCYPGSLLSIYKLVKNRSNVAAPTTEEYYRITLYNDLISHVVESCKTFLDISSHGIGLLHLSPSKCCSSDTQVQVPAVLFQAADFYEHDMPRRVQYVGEKVAAV